MLTTKMLDEMPRGVFVHGEMVDSPLGLHMMGSGRQLRWVATRGNVPDWAIYCHWADEDPPLGMIAAEGQKVCSMEHVKRLVSCDEGALARYRQ